MTMQRDRDVCTGIRTLFSASCSLVLLVFFPGIVTVQAQTLVDGTNLTIRAAVEIALRDNAELKSLRARWEAMQERPVQVGALPNPMLSYSGMDGVSGGPWPDTNEKRVMVQQSFPWFGKRTLRADIAAKDAEVMQRELETMTRDVMMMVKESCFDLHAVQRSITITREEEAVLQRMVTVAESLYAAGDRSQVDVLKARTEITMLKQKLLDQQVRENTLKAKLNMLLNRPADSPLALAVSPQDIGGRIPAGDSLTRAETNRPEILAAQAQVERYALEKRLMAKEGLPDYSLGVEYRDIGDSDNMAMFTVNVELPFWQTTYRAGVREAEKMRMSSEAALDAARQQAAFDIQDATFRLQAAWRTLDLYTTELIPQAEARFQASEAGYRTGKVDFMDLLESEQFLLNTRIMAAMAEGAVGMQAARLERVVGVAGGMGSGGVPSE